MIVRGYIHGWAINQVAVFFERGSKDVNLLRPNGLYNNGSVPSEIVTAPECALGANIEHLGCPPE